MCTHEESTRPANAWQLIGQPEHALFHLFRVDDLLHCILLALEKIDDEDQGPGPALGHVAGVCKMAESEISAALSALEDELKPVTV